MKLAFKQFLLLLFSFALIQAALADDDDDDDDRDERRAPIVKFEDNKERYKYEYRDRHCRYKYEYKYRTGKTKVEQKGDCRGIAMARPVAHGEPPPRAIPPDPGVRRVVCNREVLGSIIGGVIGAKVGSQVGEGRDRPVTTVGGAVIGAVVGGAIGRSMVRGRPGLYGAGAGIRESESIRYLEERRPRHFLRRDAARERTFG